MRYFAVLILFFVLTSHLYGQWTTPVPIDTSSSGGQLGGYMALDDSGNIYVTWAGYTPSGTQQSVVIQRSTNRGVTWTRTDYVPGSDLARTPTDIDVDHNGTVWLLWHSLADEFAPTYLNLSKSTDNGRTFTTAFRSRAYANGFMHSKLAVDVQNSIYMLWDDAQFKLTKFRHGDITQRVDAEIPNDTLKVDYQPDLAVSRDFVVHCVWEGFFYHPNTGYHVFVFCSTSTDTGATFQGRTRVDTVDRIASSYVHHYPSAAVDSNGTVFVSYTRELMVNQRDNRIAKSTDRGIRFGPPLIISDSTSYESLVCIDSPQGGVNILFGSPLGSLHRRSDDGGVTFGQPSLVGRMGPRSVRAAEDGFLYASGESGFYVYFTKTNIITSVPIIAVTPKNFELSQNYPNPFNPSTTINFRLPELSIVVLTVYDVLGRKVTELVNGTKESGYYSVIWNAKDLSSGVYFARLAASNTNEIVKLRKVIKLLFAK